MHVDQRSLERALDSTTPDSPALNIHSCAACAYSLRWAKSANSTRPESSTPSTTCGVACCLETGTQVGSSWLFIFVFPCQSLNKGAVDLLLAGPQIYWSITIFHFINLQMGVWNQVTPNFKWCSSYFQFTWSCCIPFRQEILMAILGLYTKVCPIFRATPFDSAAS